MASSSAELNFSKKVYFSYGLPILVRKEKKGIFKVFTRSGKKAEFLFLFLISLIV
jgi:hypothetical protein